MVSNAAIFSFSSPVLLKQWEQQGALYHPASHTTLLLNQIMYQALEQLQSAPQSVDQLATRLSNTSSNEKEYLLEHLNDGLTSLYIDGILLVNETI